MEKYEEAKVLGKVLLCLYPVLRQGPGHFIYVTVTDDGNIAVVLNGRVYAMKPEQACWFFSRALMLAEFLVALRERRDVLKQRGLPTCIPWIEVKDELYRKRGLRMDMSINIDEDKPVE